MKEGTLTRVTDDQDPRKSIVTTLIGAALSVGAKFASNKINDSIDENGVREVTWAMDGDAVISFKPDFEEEEIDFAEFRRRFESLEWCEDNLDHPIAYLRVYRDKMLTLKEQIKDFEPAARIKSGKKTVTIPADATDEQRKEILSFS